MKKWTDQAGAAEVARPGPGVPDNSGRPLGHSCYSCGKHSHKAVNSPRPEMVAYLRLDPQCLALSCTRWTFGISGNQGTELNQLLLSKPFGVMATHLIHSLLCLRQGWQTDLTSLWQTGNGRLEALTTWILRPNSWHRGKVCCSLILPPWKNHGTGVILPIPGPGEGHPAALPCSLSVALLPFKCSALSHCSLNAGLSEGQGLSTWLTYAAKQAGSWLYLEIWKHGIHNAE